MFYAKIPKGENLSILIEPDNIEFSNGAVYIFNDKTPCFKLSTINSEAEDDILKEIEELREDYLETDQQLSIRNLPRFIDNYEKSFCNYESKDNYQIGYDFDQESLEEDKDQPALKFLNMVGEIVNGSSDVDLNYLNDIKYRSGLITRWGSRENWEDYIYHFAWDYFGLKDVEVLIHICCQILNS